MKRLLVMLTFLLMLGAQLGMPVQVHAEGALYVSALGIECYEDDTSLQMEQRVQRNVWRDEVPMVVVLYTNDADQNTLDINGEVNKHLLQDLRNCRVQSGEPFMERLRGNGVRSLELAQRQDILAVFGDSGVDYVVCLAVGKSAAKNALHLFDRDLGGGMEGTLRVLDVKAGVSLYGEKESDRFKETGVLESLGGKPPVVKLTDRMMDKVDKVLAENLPGAYIAVGKNTGSGTGESKDEDAYTTSSLSDVGDALRRLDSVKERSRRDDTRKDRATEKAEERKER